MTLFIPVAEKVNSMLNIYSDDCFGMTCIMMPIQGIHMDFPLAHFPLLVGFKISCPALHYFRVWEYYKRGHGILYLQRQQKRRKTVITDNSVIYILTFLTQQVYINYSVLFHVTYTPLKT